jgi:ferritin
MLNKKMEAAINGQINHEMYSAFLYMSMSAYSTLIGLKGFANWFMVQYHEEMLHAMKMYEYVLKQGGAVQLAAVKAPPATFKSTLDMFQKTLEHERFITKCINDLVDLAVKEKDHASHIFLQWYITEQIEEESNDNDILAKLALVGDDRNGLFMVDKDLAARITTVPTEYSKGVEAAMAAAGKAAP